MEEKQVESQQVKTVWLRLAMTNLPAGSGHLLAETCPLAESAAAPCRQTLVGGPKEFKAVHIRAYMCMTLKLMH